MNRQNQQNFQVLCRQYRFTDQQNRQMFRYVELLEKWNRRTNLFSRHDTDVIVSKHVAESLDFCHSGLVPKRGRLLDLGSGGGFPGIPIKIYCPGLYVLLMDSIRKKYLFLSEAIQELGLDGIEPVCTRIEDFSRRPDNVVFDVVTARAVTKLVTLWKWAEPVLSQNGVLVTQKGGDLLPELEEMKKIIQVSVLTVARQNDKKFVVLKKK